MPENTVFVTPKKMVLITCRVDIIEHYNERRDALDQQWISLLMACGYLPVIAPANREWLEHWLAQNEVSGVLLTGGNDLVAVGGSARERDDAERWLINYCESRRLPLLGVCRGMQLIGQYFGADLKAVDKMVEKQQINIIDGCPVQVNSFHHYALAATPEMFSCFATSEDGAVIKGIKHQQLPITGIMWHPERRLPFNDSDKQLIQELYQ